MTGRKLGYILVISLFAFLFSLPQIVLGIGAGWIGYTHRTWPIPASPLLCKILRFRSEFAQASFWRGGFVKIGWKQTPTGAPCRPVTTVDPESGASHSLNLELPADRHFRSCVVGERIWFLDVGSNESYEVVDGALRRSSFTIPHPDMRDWRFFRWKGDVASIDTTPTGLGVVVHKNGVWMPIGDLLLPDFSRDRLLGGVSIPRSLKKPSFRQTPIDVIDSDSGLHLFLHIDGRLLYRSGLPISELATIKAAGVFETGGSEVIHSVSRLNEPDSTINGLTSADDLNGWSVVGDRSTQADLERRMPDGRPELTHGFVIEGVPFAVIIDELATGVPIGHLYRFDGAAWREVGSQPFPFGSCNFRFASNQDDSHAYLVAMTSIGVSHFFSVDANGFHKTEYIDFDLEQSFANTILPIVVLVGSLGLGILFGGIVSFVMWTYTKPDYEFGMQKIKLASLGWRGVARLIDLALVASTTLGVGWIVTAQIDWLALADSLNMRLDHPVVHTAGRAIIVMGAWMLGMLSSGIIIQAMFGITPGKWLCRLRTVQTSLRPCGFVRSLARETLFLVDCCNCLCWSPGILSIAVTDYRQRFGDIVADTIVVESR